SSLSSTVTRRPGRASSRAIALESPMSPAPTTTTSGLVEVIAACTEAEPTRSPSPGRFAGLERLDASPRGVREQEVVGPEPEQRESCGNAAAQLVGRPHRDAEHSPGLRAPRVSIANQPLELLGVGAQRIEPEREGQVERADVERVDPRH